MKINNKFLYILSAIFIVVGCTQTKKEATNTNIATDSVTGKINNINSETIYRSLPLVNLPIEFSMEFLESFSNYKSLNENEYYLLTDINESNTYYARAFKAARLPQKDSSLFIITGYESLNEEWVLELYILSEKFKPKGHVQLYAIEEVDGGANVIAQIFKITADYRITVSKLLNDKLIEQLTYKPTLHGIFEEVRDGKTTTVAYESQDMQNYTIETFIWDYNPSGGLIKKDLKTEYYQLGKDKNTIKASTDSQQEDEKIKMSIMPQEYNVAPEKLSLTITNNATESIQFGADYEIDKWVNGKWVKLNYTDDMMFIAIMHMLEPGKSENYEIHLNPGKNKYEKGKYRIRKNILTGEQSIPFYADFSITG